MSRKIGSSVLLPLVLVLGAACADSPMAPATPRENPGPVSPAPVEQKSVSWIVITPAGGTLPQALGTSRQLGVIARAQDGTEIVGRPVAWSSSNPAVASVSSTGLLEAHAAGTAWVVAVVDARRDSTLVSVASLIARIVTDPVDLTLGVGDERTIVASAFDAQGNVLARAYSWNSSNVAVATVDAMGRVVAKGAGTALITVASEGKNASIKITVTGQQWLLTDVAGAPLPEILYVDTITIGGVARESRFQVTDATLRMRDGRWVLQLNGLRVSEGMAPQLATLRYEGVVAYDVLSGGPLFFEGDEWANQTPRFRSSLRENGGFELHWSRQQGGSTVALGFAL